jgi:REP element-mobilizing transposase RayT
MPRIMADHNVEGHLQALVNIWLSPEWDGVWSDSSCQIGELGSGLDFELNGDTISGMARPLRIEIEDGVYHVTTRGWERRRIVRSDREREDWLESLDQVVTRCGWRVFAWVLMTNHFHLFVRTPEANLSAGMHDLNSGYASLFNRRYRRAGSLFQGRFKGQAPMVDRGRRQLRA